MAKRRIHLTESQLHRLIEQSINEISTETKMSAANKANQERFNYFCQASKGDKNPQLRKYLDYMEKKRARQANVFSKGVEDDVMNINGVTDAMFEPADHSLSLSSPQRGTLVTNEPYYYGQRSRHLYGLEPYRGRWEDYLQGNSYYENGKWKRPGDWDYDIEKSQWWSSIRDKNESIAHRVTESVMRKLREDVDADNKQFADLLRRAYGQIQRILSVIEEISRRGIVRTEIIQRDNNNMMQTNALLEKLCAYVGVGLEGSTSQDFRGIDDEKLFDIVRNAFSVACKTIDDAIEIAPLGEYEHEEGFDKEDFADEDSVIYQMLNKILGILEYVAQKW